MRLIMPMAGLGSRFDGQIKPMIDVDGVPMFVHSERCTGIDFEHRVFIVQRSHNLRESILEYYPDSTVLETDGVTEGTAMTILLAQEWFGTDGLFISNCDQHIEWDARGFQRLVDSGVDGVIANFHCPDRSPKWSYALVTSDDQITRVAEKDPISDWATAGFYYWRDPADFVAATLAMVAADDRVNNEFYTCPVYNYTLALPGGRDIRHYPVSSMMGTGTPEDLRLWQDR